MLNGLKDVVRRRAFRDALHRHGAHRWRSARRSRGISVFLVREGRRGRLDARLSDRGRLAGLRRLFRECRRRRRALIGEVGRAIAADRSGRRRGHRRALRRRRRRDAAPDADTVEYTKQRKQFDAPIAPIPGAAAPHGRHVHGARAGGLDDLHGHAQARQATSAERTKAVSAAKVQIGKAPRFVGQSAIQLHGGMGMTDELRRQSLLQARDDDRIAVRLGGSSRGAHRAV